MTAGPRTMRRLIPWTGTTAPPVDWDAVFAAELPRVYNFFRYRFGDNALAQDLTSITFEKAWRARERYRRDLAAFSTWLIAIARNVANDYYRRAQAHGEVELDTLADQPGPETPEQTLARREELAALGALLAQLPARDRELLALKYGANSTNRAIAVLTGLSESNVGTLLHRIVTRLRVQWEKEGN